jgi:hypothetical protein
MNAVLSAISREFGKSVAWFLAGRRRNNAEGAATATTPITYRGRFSLAANLKNCLWDIRRNRDKGYM